jgi:hypothetical protein
MADTIVGPSYEVILPQEVRSHIIVGQRFTVSVSEDGQLVLTPTSSQPASETIDAILDRTAGLWRGRHDIPVDGVEYVDQLRQAHRLNDLMNEDYGR